MMKEKIEELRKAAQARLDGATDPEAVKQATADLSALDDLEKEADEMTASNAQLLASYKEIVRGQPLHPKKEDLDDPDDPENGHGLSFEEALNKVLEARKAKN